MGIQRGAAHIFNACYFANTSYNWKDYLVGFDDELIQLMEMLTGQQCSRQTISIVGMGGIGKTTLARNVYENLVIKQHFDIRVWATISQQCNVKEILLELLSCQGKSATGTVNELGEQLYKGLSSRRYLIILDDMWSVDVWDNIKFFFPDNGNRSRVVLTTRLSPMAIQCGSSFFRMNFLDEDKSWNLFCEKAFGQEDCPLELEKIGKRIAKLCRGLPLSIVVIGGLLRKSNRTIGHWQNVAKNINSILSLGESKKCVNVLSLSYNQLPPHLKPCFLYMGVFRENYEIRVSKMIKLWVSEGFIKPNGAQTLEEIAEVYLKELIDRNLILVGRSGRSGKIRSCRIHDLLRDLCLRVAEKEKFFFIAKALSIPQGIDRERRLVFHSVFSSNYDNYEVFNALQSASLARSLICTAGQLPVNFKLLRVSHRAYRCSLEDKFQNVNLRYFAYRSQGLSMSMLSSSISLIWNLQTLIIRGGGFELIVAPLEIWKMPQLRHVECNKIYLPDPPPSEQDDLLVLRNLQTLTEVVNFRCSEEACKRIPNIKKLNITYDDYWKGCDDSLYNYLHNLGRFHKLESLNVKFFFLKLPISIDLLKKNTFPCSLNRLSLMNCHLQWEDLTMIGSLPQLEVLRLEVNSVVGHTWSPINGEFLHLKFLSISRCDLRSWIADSSHFPVLEKLVLVRLRRLEEIPWGIGEIPTLELIRLDQCGESTIISAMKMKEEQECLGNDGLQVQVKITPWSSESFRKRVETEGLTINNILLEEVMENL